jgi:hypothetical protein
MLIKGTRDSYQHVVCPSVSSAPESSLSIPYCHEYHILLAEYVGLLVML